MDPSRLARITDEPSDTRRFAAMTPDERLEVFAQVCELADAIVRGRPDPERLREPWPRSPEAQALWRRLMDRGRDEQPRR